MKIGFIGLGIMGKPMAKNLLNPCTKYPGLYYFHHGGNPRKSLICKGGRRGGNRTHNPRLRRPVLYPIELLAHVFYCSCELNEARGAAETGVSAATA